MNSQNLNRSFYAAILVMSLAILPGCASKTPGEPLKVNNNAAYEDATDNHDPLEVVNRGIFRFNEVVDGVLLKPLAHIYMGLMPDFAQTGVKNALTNLSAPVVFVDSLFQADVNNAEKTLGRFVINSTIGIAGLFDVATPIGIKKEHNKDFGQTLGVYGLGTGPYLMLPILGPSDIRDGVGMLGDLFIDPFTYILTTDEQIAIDATRTIVKRGELIPLTNRVYRDSLDPYATFRSIYLQNRAKIVRDYKSRDVGLEKDSHNK